MENTNTSEELYGTFHVTVDDRKLNVEPAFSHNNISYKVSEGENFLFTLQLDDKAQWNAVNEGSEPEKPSQSKWETPSINLRSINPDHKDYKSVTGMKITTHNINGVNSKLVSY